MDRRDSREWIPEGIPGVSYELPGYRNGPEKILVAVSVFLTKAPGRSGGFASALFPGKSPPLFFIFRGRRAPPLS